jgi:hypothetical protein
MVSERYIEKKGNKVREVEKRRKKLDINKFVKVYGFGLNEPLDQHLGNVITQSG